MVPFFALLLATACVATDGHSCKTHAPQEPTASAAGSDEEEEEAALLQFSFNQTHHTRSDCLCCTWENTWESGMTQIVQGRTCCAYCLNDKGHSDKRVCITKTAEKHDARPFCNSCGGVYTPGVCTAAVGPRSEKTWGHCAWQC
mmetsp:Transcript_40749/g.82146  ORF Transcript_40749/g.82146 Transcript_40749/m.82146 type:complete len:144 (+) Transcript_40749:94-525(+)